MDSNMTDQRTDRVIYNRLRGKIVYAMFFLCAATTAGIVHFKAAAECVFIFGAFLIQLQLLEANLPYSEDCCCIIQLIQKEHRSSHHATSTAFLSLRLYGLEKDKSKHWSCSIANCYCWSLQSLQLPYKRSILHQWWCACLATCIRCWLWQLHLSRFQYLGQHLCINHHYYQRNSR